MDLPLSSEFLNSLGVVGICVFILLLLIFGKGLTLNSRVKDRDAIIEKQDATIEWQRAALDAKDDIISDLTGGARVSATALQKIGQAAEQIAGGETP